MKLAAKFARQETELARLARIRRRRIPKDREDAVRRMLDIPESVTGSKPPTRVPARGPVECPECARAFHVADALGETPEGKAQG